jgi:hypothetical protein
MKLLPVRQEPARGFGLRLEPLDEPLSDQEKLSSYVDAYNLRNPDKPITVKDIPDRSGFTGGIRELLVGTVDAARDQFPEDLARAWQGGDVHLKNEGWAQRWIDEEDQDRQQRVLSKQVILGDKVSEALYYGPRSTASSAAAGLGGSGIGAAATSWVPAPGARIVGGIVGAGAASGTAFYRMAKNNFLHMVLDQAKANNVDLSEEEWDTIRKDVDAEASKYGLWEAGPEALSQAFTAGLFKGVGGKLFSTIPGFKTATDKLAKSALARVGAKFGAEVAEEEATEYVTYLGQSGIEQRQGLRSSPPSLSEFAGEQAGAVAVGALLQGGAFHLAEHSFGRAHAPVEAEPKAPVDLLQREESGQAGAQEDFYSEDAVARRYETEHAAPFPEAHDLLAQGEPDVRPYREPTPVADRAGTEYQDVPGYSADEVEQRYLEAHVSPMPGPELFSRPLDQARPVGGLPGFSEQATGTPFSPEETAAMLAQSPEPQNIPSLATLEASPQEGDAPSVPVPLSGSEMVLLDADNRPFGSRGEAAKLVLQLRKEGRTAGITPVPGGFGVFVETAYDNLPRAKMGSDRKAFQVRSGRTEDENSYREVFGYKVSMPGYKGVDFFVARNGRNWQAFEASTGRSLGAAGRTRNEALSELETLLEYDTTPTDLKQRIAVFQRTEAEQGAYLPDSAPAASPVPIPPPVFSPDAPAGRVALARTAESVPSARGALPLRAGVRLEPVLEDAGQGQLLPAGPVPSATAAPLTLRTDGKPFPTRRGAESQAGRMRRKGRRIEVREMPGGGFGLADLDVQAVPEVPDMPVGDASAAPPVIESEAQISASSVSGQREREPVSQSGGAAMPPQLQAEVRTVSPDSPAKEEAGQEREPGAEHDSELRGMLAVASEVGARLEQGEAFTWRELQQWADAGFAATQAQGGWNIKQAYDAMELAVNRFLRTDHPDLPRLNPATMSGGEVTQAVQTLEERVLALLPTQTRRTEEMLEYQQFSTPPHLALVAAWAGRPASGEVVLEPSAGVGGLAVWAANAGTEVHVNELDPRRRNLLEQQDFSGVTGENAEQLDNVLPEDLRPTLVLMNPPFSSTAGRKKGERKTRNMTRHLDQALARLEPGGRLVAILSDGMSVDKAHMADWWRKVRKAHTLRANIRLNGEIYRKYGTSYDNLLIVIDKVQSDDDYVNIEARQLDEAIQALEEVRNARTAVAEQRSRERGGQGGVGEGQGDSFGGPVARPATGALGAGEREDRGQGLHVGGVRAGAVPPGKSGVGDASALRADGRGVRGRGAGGTGGDVRAGEHGGRDDARGTGGGDTGEHQHESRDSGPELHGRGPSERHALITVREASPDAQSQGEFTDSLYESYRPQRMRIEGAREHPTPLVQSAAMAAVEPPAPRYVPHLPEHIVSSGALSEAQLEQVVYAGQAHQDRLPDGIRRGYFIGDGTGVGKGRTIAGVILDNALQGRTKAVWVSVSADLYQDARRDVEGIGDDPAKVFPLSKYKMGQAVDRTVGVLFTTYETVRQTPQNIAAAAREGFEGGRLDQIISWLGKDFDGVVVFDESHKMGNAIEIKEEGSRGTKKPAKCALAGVELQKRLPDARILYVSATGATEPSNLSYAERLGLWGEGTSFADKRNFINAVQSGGVAAMELVSRDLKAMGGYLARTLSYDGVTYDRLEHKLSTHQQKAYDTYAQAWQVVLANIQEALEATGQQKDANARSTAMSQFWGNHQRFFNQVLTSMTMPSVLADIRQELDAGHSCVVQLVNTNEASQERAMDKAKAEGEDLAGLDVTPRQMLMEYVTAGFPVHQFEEYTDDDGNTKTRLARDSRGNPVENRGAVRMRDKLLERLMLLKVPGNPLDMIIEEIGSEQVAEITGRKSRIVDGREQRRGKAAANKEAEEFMEGKRRVLVFSQAGGTGRSYHADRNAKNQQKRIHYILQAGWRADAATQGLGRTHRSNEALPPHYKLVTTDLKGHRRFTSSIARRLDQLGALTQGQRQAGSQGLFSTTDNLENDLAKAAWVWLCEDIYKGNVEGVGFDEFQQETSMRLLREDESGHVYLDPPEIKQFLNRLLSMSVEMQNRVFDAFEQRLTETYRLAEEGGRLDQGVVTLKAERIDALKEEVVHTDQRSGAETKVIALRLHEKREMQDFDAFRKGNSEPEGWWRNKGSWRVYAVYPGGLKQDSDGRLVERRLLKGVLTNAARKISLDELAEGFEQVKAGEARKAWNEAYEGMEKTVERDAWMITGMLLPVWTQISGRPNVFRLRTSDGRRHLGRLMTRDEYETTRENLGLGRDVPKYTPEQAVRALLRGRKLSLRGGYEIEPRRVAGEVRLELSGEAVPFEVEALKQHGAFTEIVGHRMRVFVPTGAKGEAFMRQMLKLHPLTGESRARGFAGESDAHFSVSRKDAPGKGRPASMTVNTVRGAVQDMQARAKNARPLKVVQSFGDLPRRIRRQARRQGAGSVDGVYDPHEGVVWMVAEAIPSRKRAQEIWLHEQCAHQGLRGLLGDERRFRQMLRGVYESAGGRAAFRDIADTYGLDLRKEADQQTAAEEYLARLAEKVQLDEALSASERRVWRKVLRFVKELLQAMGARVGYSDAELTDLVSEAALWVFEGEARTDPSLAHDVAEWGRQLEERAAGRLHPKTVLRVGADTPDVFQKLGLEDLPLVMLHSKLGVMEREHGVAAENLKRLPALLDAPVLVMDSASLGKTLVVVLDRQDSQGRPLVAALHPQETVGRKAVHRIASVYWKDGAQAWLQKAVDEGRVRYVDKKKGVALTDGGAGLQLPGAVGTRNALQKPVLTDALVVKRDPDVRFAIAAPGQNPTLDSALSKIGSPKTSTRERFQAMKDRFRAEFEQGVFDRFASLKRIDELAGVREMSDSAYVAARMTTSLGDQVAALLEHGAPVWREGAVDVDGVGQGLASVLAPVAGELDRWSAWMVGKRAAKLAGEGRENLFTPDEIRELQALNAGREAVYDAVWRGYVRFKTKVLDFAQEAGVIDPEGRLLWEHDEYIPFYRVLDEGGLNAPHGKKGIASQYSGIRQLKGGKSNIGDPFENIIRNFSHLLDASIKNHAMEKAVSNAELAGAAYETGLQWEAVRLPAGAMQQALRKVFGDKDAVWSMNEAQRRSLQTVFHMVRPTGKDVVHVLRDGKPVYYQISDPLLLRSLTAVNQAAWNNAGMKAMRFFKRLLTRGVTSTPDFMLRNLVRDTLHAWVVDRTNTFRPVLGSLRGLARTLRKDADSVRMLAAGAAFQGGYALGHDPAAARLVVDGLLCKHGINKNTVLDTPHKLGRFLAHGWRRWEEVGGAVENATRAQLYARLRGQGRSHLESAYEAKDIMDYSMRGDWPVVRFLCETVPFFGARLTGLHRMGRGYMENPRAFLLKGAMITLASVLLYLNNKDREEYAELEDWERDNYYHFWLDGEHFRLPKPFEVGALFGTLPERITEQFTQGEDGKLFAERLWFMLNQTFSVDVPQVVAPLLEQWANKDLFTGRPIVGGGLESYKPGEQRRPWTSATASEVARALDDSGLPLPETLRSPKRLEHLIYGYFGTLGMYVLSASDMAVRALWDYPSDPEPRLRDLPLVGSFYRDGPERHTKQLTDLYEMIRETKGLVFTIKELQRTGEYDRARELAEENQDKLRFRKLAFALERRLGDVNRQMRIIHSDRTLSPAEKRTQLEELEGKRNELVKRVWGRMKN